jgi:hypothetical protein
MFTLSKQPLKKEYYRNLIRDSKGKIFSIEFIKKDGTLRKMNARISVKKGVNGKGLKYDPFEKGYLIAYDMGKDGFRTINLETITKISLNK